MRYSRNALWRRCAQLVSTVDIPEPFEVPLLVEALAARRGRPIELIPLAARPNTPCGVLAATDRADYVFYSVDTSPLHQEHILLHELGHLLCGHAGDGELHETVAQLLMPNLPVELVRRVLGRTGYAQEQEQEAELVASLIMHRARRARPAPVTGGLARLRSAFGPGV
ncbi:MULTISPECIES: ImmA/IrrE family metallo-endopeptidase [unclassified Crossiella]|uniref:ImmA/IrrE family metallo-endopeptidase n=1 Tax=unclassified Crossiella TaxID=2620835 RepID=UPI001FFF6AF6|nr:MULTISPECIES: ImmA/IrrE family metallo-endopeptidase [unclassified Crossiella]MCK2245321.1 ImmA/IrrE family metallo-endopeptidase [Crossiella sp. S99.2]MCK2258977.1 ImmA/IrrE family metallo-endopeptidase [Crossiella sp. S99.1]